jgi:DNA-binding NarL/FixJ family response regulator
MSEAQIEVTDKEGRAILLKGRYYEILKLFSQGLIKKQVGDALGLSAGTVNTYTSRLYRKLGGL